MKQKLLLIFLGIFLSFSLFAKAVAGAMGESASIKLIDHEMIDTQRRTVKLVSDAMADRIVVMNFIYTGCTTVCPVSTSIMKGVYNKIEKSQDLKASVQLISLTLNPTIDTPRKMREFSSKYGNNSDKWLWLTGGSMHVNEALLGLRAYSADVTEHSSVILVGNPVKNHWTSFYQFPNADQIVQRIHEYIENQKAS